MCGVWTHGGVLATQHCPTLLQVCNTPVLAAPYHCSSTLSCSAGALPSGHLEQGVDTACMKALGAAHFWLVRVAELLLFLSQHKEARQ